MTRAGTPEAEIDIDDRLLRDLLADQIPEYADAPIELLDAGWDNVSFRVGERCIARLPRRETAVTLLVNEQKWLPVLAPRLPIAVPVPLAAGRPSDAYPWPWSLVHFIEGKTVDLAPPRADQAEPFAAFLRALHQPAPPDAPHNFVRGVPLAHRVENIDERLARLRVRTDAISIEIEKAWEAALAADATNERNWLHGDLHARNVLVDDGTFSGVIDWGDMTAGDRASDLASIWMLFADSETRRRAFAAYDLSAEPEALFARARGWAVLFGAVLLDSGLVDHPQHAAMGEATLRRVAQEG